jgi:hypothetical protein
MESIVQALDVISKRRKTKGNNMAKPVFVLATQRSGTNYLRALLTATGRFRDFDEILHSAVVDGQMLENEYFDWSTHSYFLFRAAKYAETPSLSIPIKENVYRLITDYLEYLKTEAGDSMFFLMDVKYSSLHHFDPIWQSLSAPKYFFEILKRLKCHVIHVVRENAFNVFLSEEVAKATRRYVLRTGEKMDLPRLRMDPEETLWNLGRIEREVEMVRSSLSGGALHCEIAYEHMSSFDDTIRDREFKKLKEFLQLKADMPASVGVKKIIKDRWSIIENADEIRARILNSPYARFVQD